MRYEYAKNTPLWLKIVMVVTGLLAIFPLANLAFMGIHVLQFDYTAKPGLTELGQLGDFFGGHTSAFAGSVSLLVVLFFTFHQARQQSQFFEEQQRETSSRVEREFFLQGINLITQWDLAFPGCDQCMRLIDYYGRIALSSGDRELPLILNTVITAKIRENLQGKNGSFRRTNYPYACQVMDKISVLREADGRAAKAKREAEKKDD